MDELKEKELDFQQSITKELELGNGDQINNNENTLNNMMEDGNKNSLDENGIPYTVFSIQQKYIILYLGAICSFWSSVSTPIYYPALQILESYFNITEELVNISVVMYLIFQGLSPTVFSGLADRFGRRPVLIVCLSGYIGANIGLAVSNKYGLILGLRVIQSSFIAPTVAIQSGLVGDYTQRFERGGFIGLGAGLTLMGQGVGSLIGAGLIAGYDWRAIFWFLSIGGGVSLTLTLFLLPETNRTIVGNQSIVPKHFFNKAPILLIPYFQKKWHLKNPDLSTKAIRVKTDYLAPFKILMNPEVGICLLCQGMHFVLWTITLTTLTTQLTKSYNYSIMKIGLCYLAGGIGGLVGSMSTGRILDWNYRRCFSRFEREKEEGLIPEDTKFNIVRTRVQVSIPYLLLADASGLVFGWCIGETAHISSVIISSTVISLGCMAVVGVITTLLVDLFPSSSSAATSSINFTRCILGAVFVAALSSMNESMTVGGTFTLIVGICLLCTAGLYVPLKYGMKWRIEREMKQASE